MWRHAQCLHIWTPYILAISLWGIIIRRKPSLQQAKLCFLELLWFQFLSNDRIFTWTCLLFLLLSVYTDLSLFRPPFLEPKPIHCEDFRLQHWHLRLYSYWHQIRCMFDYGNWVVVGLSNSEQPVSCHRDPVKSAPPLTIRTSQINGIKSSMFTVTWKNRFPAAWGFEKIFQGWDQHSHQG